MHTIDDSFRQRRQASLERRRQNRRRRLLGGLAALALTAGAVGLYFVIDRLWFNDIDEELEPTELAGELPDDASVYVPTIVDLAGDPMWIVLAGGSQTGAVTRSIARPADLADETISPRIEVLADTMLSSSESFMTTIPSTQEDFAFFQAQRAAADDEMMTPVDAQGEFADEPALALPLVDASDSEAGWGETIDLTHEALPDFRRTEIENNTSLATVTPEAERFQLTEDTFVRIRGDLTLDSVVLDAGFSADDARLAGEALKSVLQRDDLEPGDVVAMRGFRPHRHAKPLLRQVSVYSTDTYLGTLARNGNGPFGAAVDPWVRDDLFNYSGTIEASGPKRNYRLLDAIYSTAARNNVPTGVIGEAIMYLSRGRDLNAFATYDQKLILIYSQTPRGDGSGGRVLYVAVSGTETNIECFIYAQSDGEFACVSQGDQVQTTVGANGMVTPVVGVLRSTFGPRKHPILNTVRLHKGVDWAAAVGTPVVAAFDGTIVFAGDGGGYGNLLRVRHEGGRETRYAHLQRFATADPVGKAVRAGEVIGYVGTTGLSTGPHLHFEIYQNGTAVDPLGTVAVATSDGSAIEVLTNRIIQVESAGRADAKNPRSSATGLGQFINTTWIRMMNTYRPDLARSLSQADLLALRFDPTISREMVRNLAREGESYLRARGHNITAGRLYLCHFLGMEGAHIVLSSPGDAMLVNVLGAGVIKANPFLTGKNTAYVIDWAERKMGRAGVKGAPQPTIVAQTKPLAPGFEQYKTSVANIVASLQAAPTTGQAIPASGAGAAQAPVPGATIDEPMEGTDPAMQADFKTK
jgi:murein DD-endopeptidase MepM/ murein hydrolase activator NlpD